MSDNLPDGETLYKALQSEISRLISTYPRDKVYLVGVYSGGAWLVQRLQQDLGIETPLGFINTTFYRDDFHKIGLHPQAIPTDISFPIDGQHLILVDDILYTGRSARAAINELFDYGRPASIDLAVLIDRGGRELPIQPNACGGVYELDDDVYFDLAQNDQNVFDISLKRQGKNVQSTTE